MQTRYRSPPSGGSATRYGLCVAGMPQSSVPRETRNVTEPCRWPLCSRSCRRRRKDSCSCAPPPPSPAAASPRPPSSAYSFALRVPVCVSGACARAGLRRASAFVFRARVARPCGVCGVVWRCARRCRPRACALVARRVRWRGGGSPGLLPAARGAARCAPCAPPARGGGRRRRGPRPSRGCPAGRRGWRASACSRAARPGCLLAASFTAVPPPALGRGCSAVRRRPRGRSLPPSPWRALVGAGPRALAGRSARVSSSCRAAGWP